MQIGAVVVTYNSSRTLPRCVQSLWAAGVTDIVVVDNASPDTSVKVARQLGVTVIALSQNRGFASGCNIGAAHLPYRTLLFLNPDAWVAAGSVTQALRKFDRHSVGVVGLRLVSPAGIPEIHNAGPRVTLRELFRRQLKQHSQFSNIGWVSGGAMLVRGDVWHRVGGFDESYFLYWEDIDLCKRVGDMGWQVIIDVNTTVWHERGASLGNLQLKTRYYDQSADKYFRKHYPIPIWLTQRLLRGAHRWFSPQVD